MNRINLFRNAVRRNPVTLNSVNWGKSNFDKTIGTVVFAALLIVCSIAVGCSSDKPQPASSNNQSGVMQPKPPVVTAPVSAPSAPVLQAATKPVHKKIVRKAPATVTYADKTSGVSFQYPQKYSLKTGDAADKLLSSDPVPMDFVRPGGFAVAVVAVPESAYPKSDLGWASFNVSMNKALTAEQCGQFPDAKPAAAVDPVPAPDPAAPAAVKPAKLMIGVMELQSSETLASQGTREEAAKYYHVFENGACYEFALKVTTLGIENQGGASHVDRGEVFKRLERILASVKIQPAEEKAIEPSVASAPAGPAQ